MKRIVFLGLFGVLLLVVTGCEREEKASAPVIAPAPTTSASAEPVKSDGVRVVFLGDSLTAGLGLDPEQAYPAVIEETLKKEGLPVRVVNAGVSGDTTAGGLSRSDWLMRQRPDVLVLALGANDGLRGIQPAASEENLRKIIGKAKEGGAEVLLLGMMMPPNYGPEYTEAFKGIYPRVAKEMGVAFVPFMLEGVGGIPEMNQRDGIHPTAEGQRRVAENVVGEVRELVKKKPR